MAGIDYDPKYGMWVDKEFLQHQNNYIINLTNQRDGYKEELRLAWKELGIDSTSSNLHSHIKDLVNELKILKGETS
jgi:hypothetical protein